MRERVRPGSVGEWPGSGQHRQRRPRPGSTADPIHLMRLFGICDSTALKYVFAADPERRTEVIR